MTAQLILVEASPRRANDGVAQTVRLAGGGGQLPYRYAGVGWRAGLVGLPTFITSIDFDGEFGAGGVPQAAELEWGPSSANALAELAGLFWSDAAVTLRIGPEGSLPPIALAGKALAASTEGGRLKIAMSDPAADLKKPLPLDRYAGTGDLEGPAEWDGKIKQRLWGRIWNIKLEPLDAPNNIYVASDPLRPILSFDALRDAGAAAASIVVLAWQGSHAATLAALRAAVVPAGGAVACPSLAAVKWWAVPRELRADLRGEIGSAYVETTAQIVQRIVQAGANTPFAPGTIAAAQALRPTPVGWVANNDSTTQAAMIEQRLGDVSLLWLLDAEGRIVIRPWAWGASVASAVSQEVKRVRTLKPMATRTLGYRANQHPMARGDIAGIVLAQDVAFPDGGTALDLALDLSRRFRPVSFFPEAEDSRENDAIWRVDLGNRVFVRIAGDGVLYDDLGPVEDDDGPIEVYEWEEISDTRVLEALGVAQEGFDKANAAIDALDALDDDGLFSTVEKRTILGPRLIELEINYGQLVASAASLSVSVTAIGVARNAFLTFLAGLTPPINNLVEDTGVDRAAFSAVRDAYDLQLGLLRDAIAARLKLLADNAQGKADDAWAKANDAIDALAGLADDGKLSRDEKIKILGPKAATLAARFTELAALAATLGVSTTAANVARAAWLSMLAAISPAWDDEDQDSPVDRATYDSARNGYDAALEALGKETSAKAATLSTWTGVTGPGKPQDGATVGAPTGTDVAGVAATLIAGATNNFNARNDRDGSAIGAPTFAGDGSALDHVIRTDGAADLSIEWSWLGTTEEIDGFHLFMRSSASAAAYGIGTNPLEETVYSLPPSTRAFILRGAAANRYVTWGIRAYRVVDPDVSASGHIYSAIAQPAASGEHPYLPSANVAFSGDITGTVAGSAATSVASGAAAASNGLNSDGTVKDDKVDTPAIVDGAINDPSNIARLTGIGLNNFPLSPPAWRTVDTITVTVENVGDKIGLFCSGELFVAANASAGSVSHVYGDLRLVRGASVIWSMRVVDSPGDAMTNSFSPNELDQPGSIGNHTYTLEVLVQQTGGSGVVRGIFNLQSGTLWPIIFRSIA